MTTEQAHLLKVAAESLLQDGNEGSGANTLKENRPCPSCDRALKRLDE